MLQIATLLKLMQKKKKKKIKEAAVPNMPFCKISWWKNVNKTWENLFVPKLQYCQFGQDGWKNKTF